MNTKHIAFLAPAVLLTAVSMSTQAGSSKDVADSVIAEQRANLASNTEGKGFGPQSPRDIDTLAGNNKIIFSEAPSHTQMNLCNIHFHSGAEHKGGEFTTYQGNGDGKGHGTGFLYDGKLTKSQLKPYKGNVCGDKGHGLKVGETLEVHFVHSTAPVKPGPTLGSCLADSIGNPQLRVETQVIVLANDSKAIDFTEMTQIAEVNGYHQAPNIPTNMGAPVQYEGSTTGPKYNEGGSPFQVSWSVRPKVAVVDIASVDEWCDSNVFKEDHAHGVRNLVINPDLLSKID